MGGFFNLCNNIVPHAGAEIIFAMNTARFTAFPGPCP